MQDLTVTGVDNGALLLSSNGGTRYRLPINDSLHSKLRQAAPGARSATGSGGERKLAPREIQAQIRSGLSAHEVAAVTGVPVEYIQKFEGPVLAEREFVVESALNVAVHTAMDDADPMSQGSTFGSVIRERLHDLGATAERWASWKEAEGGWVVKLAFTADQIDHDARWHYEPRKAALAPLNNEAKTLSQQGEMPGALIPRLRAVGDERVPDSSRFDSAAFDLKQPRAGDAALRDTAPQLEAVPFGRAESSPEVAAAAINRAPVDHAASSQTADLLEALRRRRGERESAAQWDEAESGETARPAQAPTGSIRIVDVPAHNDIDEDTVLSAPRSFSAQIGSAPRTATPAQSGLNDGRAGALQPPVHGNSAQAHPTQASSAQTGPVPGQVKGSSRRGRAAMPSWDEIVFGARSDDDLS